MCFSNVFNRVSKRILKFIFVDFCQTVPSVFDILRHSNYFFTLPPISSPFNCPLQPDQLLSLNTIRSFRIDLVLFIGSLITKSISNRFHSEMLYFLAALPHSFNKNHSKLNWNTNIDQAYIFYTILASIRRFIFLFNLAIFSLTK